MAHNKRIINKATEIGGRLVREFRRTRARLAQGGRRNILHMTVAELAHVYQEANLHVTGDDMICSEAMINRLERGEERLSPVRIAVLSRALRLKPWERALLEEIAGFRGILRQLADELLIPVPNIWQRVLDESKGTATLDELRLIVEEWVAGAKEDLYRRVRLDIEATIHAEVETAARLHYDEKLREAEAQFADLIRPQVETEVTERLSVELRQEIYEQLRREYDVQVEAMDIRLQAQYRLNLEEAKLNLLRDPPGDDQPGTVG